ncbi:MAG: hypothetical protein Q9198_004951 [Flavoplaca austrocitrina]
MIRPSMSQITIDIIDLSIGYHYVKNVDIDINVKLRIVDLDDIKPVDVPHFNFDIDVFERHIFDLTDLILPNVDLSDLDFSDLDFPDLDFPDLDFPDLDFPDLNVQ